MKLTLSWKSDKDMKALFSNINSGNPNNFYLVMVFHKSNKGGFDRNITKIECEQLLTKHNPTFKYVEL